MLSRDDLDAARAVWEEWTSGLGYDLDVQVVGDHQAAVMDPDRALGAIVRASLSLRLVIMTAGRVVFDERCPCDGFALLVSVRALARTVADADGS